jgi:hypothetical protein
MSADNRFAAAERTSSLVNFESELGANP